MEVKNLKHGKKKNPPTQTLIHNGLESYWWVENQESGLIHTFVPFKSMHMKNTWLFFCYDNKYNQKNEIIYAKNFSQALELLIPQYNKNRDIHQKSKKIKDFMEEIQETFEDSYISLRLSRYITFCEHVINFAQKEKEKFVEILKIEKKGDAHE